MSNAPLYDALLRYAEKNPLRLHMPGHAGKRDEGVLSSVFAYDVTEIPETGNAFTGEGPCGEALDAADIFYGGTTVFSSAGATLCLQTAIALAAKPGDMVVVDRRCHKSVLNALILLDLRPFYLYPEGEGAESYLSITKLKLALLMMEKPPALVILTSPTYYGLITDISAAISVCHEADVPILFDHAHGAHLCCLPELHPFFQGADYCVDSPHKTLPVLTGGAMLHCRRPRKEVLETMKLFGSTSPSFPILASLDRARALCEEEGPSLFQNVLMNTWLLRNTLLRKTPFTFPAIAEGCAADPLRLTLDCKHTGLAPSEIQRLLSKQGIELEMVDARYAVAILSLLHTEEDFAKLSEALCTLPFQDKPLSLPSTPLFRLKNILSPREAYFLPKEHVSLSEASGRTAGEALYFYPPGIPLCTPGEELSPSFCERYAADFDSIAVISTL